MLLGNSWLLSTKNVQQKSEICPLMYISLFLKHLFSPPNTPVVQTWPRSKPRHLWLLVYHNPRQHNENIVISLTVTGIIWDTNPLKNERSHILINMHRFVLTLHGSGEYQITNIIQFFYYSWPSSSKSKMHWIHSQTVACTALG